MFIEVNEIGTYDTGQHDKNGYAIWKPFIKGKMLINTDYIRSISISSYKWKDAENHIIDEDSLIYTVYFDKDRSETILKEDYDKVKELILIKKENTIFD